ncbi:MAG: hypothetical protein ABI171_11795 [Collimonas sp.]|uniref:hypothetical protein n=1 Tax=Collimonas sp. TaxID=1963772 RepID=UPI003265A648
MATSGLLSGSSVFAKTGKGRDEIARRCFGLPPRQRRVLIVMDGTKDLATIAEAISRDELAQAVLFLNEQGFIALTSSDAKMAESGANRPRQKDPAATPELTTSRTSLIQKQAVPPAATDNAQALDAPTLREVKDFMTTTAQTYLGLLAADLIQRIERTKNQEGLKSIVGQWHMALRDSKHGARFASSYLDQVTATLSGNAPELSRNHV